MSEAPSGKRSGNVKVEDYTQEAYLQKLDRLVQRLNEDPAAFKFDKKSLAQLVAGLQQFMEDALGINAVYKPAPKLPAKLLRNYAPDGPLYTVASECGKHMKAKGLKRMDWQNPATRKENMDLLSRIRQELLRGGHLRTPRVFVHPSTGPAQLKLRDTVKRLGGETAQAADAQGVTHVVLPFGPKGDPDDGQQYLRTLEVAGAKALVHWWYLPDSYDEWVPADTAPSEIEADKRPKGPWKVYVRWLTDSDKYNEWMNEVDYETEEAQAEAEAAGAKRKAEGGVGVEAAEEAAPTAKKARMTGGAKPLPEVDPAGGEVVAPGVTKQTVIQPNRKAMEPATAVDISQGQRPEGSGVPQATPPDGQPPAAIVTAPQPQQPQQQEQQQEQGPAAGGEGGSGSRDQEMTPASQEGPSGAEGAEAPAAEAAGEGAKPKVEGTEEAAGPVPAAVQPAAAAPAPAPAAPPAEQQPGQQLGPAQGQGQGQGQQGGSGGAGGEKVVARQAYRIPAMASWFSWNGVNQVEKEACPEFFSGQDPNKTPVVYREVRNALINKYREDPSRELDFTTARKSISLDVGAVQSVYDRLVDWGLINFTARQKASSMLPLLELVPDDRLPSGVRVSSCPPGHEALLRLPLVVKAAEGAEAAALGGGGSARVTARRGTFGPAGPEPPAIATGVRYFCNAMPWVDCTELRYHCTKIPDIDLCPDAYAEGRFPPGCTARDFVRLDARQSAPDPSGWTDQETLLLLEGLELHGDNWAQIAEHVGTKTQMQCILHFLQMPIEEQFLGDLGATRGRAGWTEPPPPPGEAGKAAGGAEPSAAAAAGAAGEGRQGGEAGAEARAVAVPEDLIPFADVGNPVMAQVAFLAAMVGPRVAAAAAQRALEVLAEEDPSAAAAAAELQGEGGANGTNGSQAAAAAAAGGGAISTARLRTAAATALSAAAVKARLLADAEERECQRLVIAAVEAQFRKVQLKLQYLEQLDEVMVAERAQLEAMRTQLSRDRASLMDANAQAQQVQQAAALQVAQLQQQAALFQHSAAQQVKAAQQAAAAVLGQQPGQGPPAGVVSAAGAQGGTVSGGAGGTTSQQQ